MNNPDFVSFINSYDIIHLSETKLDSLDDVNVDGYSFIGKYRFVFKNRSGGVGILIKNSLFDKIEVLDISCENCLWYRFKDTSYIFAVVYIPPEGSKYGNLDIFDKLENDIIDINSQYDNASLLIFGDFNAKTGRLPDYTVFDEYIAENYIDTVSEENMTLNGMVNLGLPLERFSQDNNNINNYGYRFLELCKSTGLLIANGRCGNDIHIGKNTCNDSSLLDYLLLSLNNFSNTKNFEVLDFDPILSDIHNSLTVEFYIGNIVNVIEPQNNDIEEERDVTENCYKKPIWDNSVRQLFVDSLDQASIDEYSIEFARLFDDKSYNENCINDITKKVSEILFNAADKCNLIIDVKNKPFGRSCNSGNNSSKNKKWFDDDCTNARKKYLNSKRHHRRYKTHDSYLNMVSDSKVYKKTINKKIRDYQNDVNKKLSNLRSSDPKAFWSLLNKYSNEGKETFSKISKETFFEHFVKLNEAGLDEDDNQEVNIDFEHLNSNNAFVNADITIDEIKKIVKKLKNNKSPSAFDHILNEYLKYANESFLQLLCQLFNIILDSGIFPDVWSKGIIHPIYKNKGDKDDPNNYRGITILSCMGKLFTNILNERLNIYLESCNLLSEEQAGFRKNYGTIDHVFSLKLLIDFYLKNKQKLFCAFVDYRKAFDSLNRLHLWNKLLSHNIDGRCLKIIHNMYQKAKSCVKVNNVLTGFFSSYTGVRQGENLSPILFSIYLNDLTQFMSCKMEGLTTMSSVTQACLSDDTIDVYLKLYLLLYADDTVLLAENKFDLQNGLNAMNEYCNIWGLQVNEAKTKIVIFSSHKINKETFIFKYNNRDLEIVDEFSYLGVLFNYNGRFCKAKKRIIEQARKAMFSIVKKARKLNLPISIQLHLFNSMVVPILLYGSEVWGIENLQIMEQFQLRFCKLILNLKASTPNCMIYGETGLLPLELQIKTRILNFWAKLINSKDEKICNVLYRTVHYLHVNNVVASPWVSFVSNIFNELGLTYYFESQQVINLTHFKNVVKCRLKDHFLQNWQATVADSHKCLVYRIYKKNLSFEKYLDILPTNLGKLLCKYRTTNHLLPIEKGRHLNIDRNHRKCQKCTKQSLGDEFHYLFECKFFKDSRKKFVDDQFTTHPNVYTLERLMNSTDYHTLLRLALFCKTIMSKFK